MATRYWVGGAGTWNTTSTTNWSTSSGGGSGASAPTSTDDVIIDTSSGTGVITCTGAVCNDITVTATQAITLGAASSTLSVFGNLTFPSGNSFAVDTDSYVITLAATTTGKTVTTNGKTIGNLTVNGVGGGWTLGSALTSNRALTLTNGTFDTSSVNNYALTIGAIGNSGGISLGSGTKTLNLNASTVTNNGSLPIAFTTNSTNFTFNAGTSTINCGSASATFAGGGFTFYNVSIGTSGNNSHTLNGDNTFNNLTIVNRSATGTNRLSLGGNQTVNGTFTCNSTNTLLYRRYWIFSSVAGTNRTITAAAIDIFGTDFKNITGAGAASWTDSSRTKYWGDAGGNSGITFATGRNAYWNLAGTQNWTATAWALTNNGAPAAANYPLIQDTATFTEAGSAGTVQLNTSSGSGSLGLMIGNITMADGVSNRTTAMTIDASSGGSDAHFGSITLFSNLTISSTSRQLEFHGYNNTQSITSAGKTFWGNFLLLGYINTVQLQDNYIGTTRGLTVSSGGFDANGYDVSTAVFTVNNNTNIKTVTMGSGTWTLANPGSIWNLSVPTNLTLNANTSTIVLSDTSASSRTFAGGGLTYNNLTIGGATGTSTLTITGANTFNTLASTKTVAHTITFPNVTTTVSDWTIKGTAGNVVTLTRTGGSGTFTLAKSGGGVISGLDYLSISNSTASPTNTWYAGANSTNGGGNTNWLFTVAPVFGSASITASATVSTLGNIIVSANALINATATVSANGILEVIVLGSASINGTATASASGNLVKLGVGYINGTASVSAFGGLLNSGQASINGTATVSAIGGFIFNGTASINGTATVTADGYYIADGVAAISAFANVTALPNAVSNGVAGITANGTVIAKGTIQGEGWNPVTPSTDTWTDASPSSDTWTTISPSSDTWLRQG